MELYKDILLGIVQGATEMLPVSSSGHLALIEYWLRVSNPLQVAVFLHFGSFIAILFALWKDIRAAFKSRVALLVVISLAFTGIVAFPIHKTVTSMFGRPLAVGSMLVLNGVLLLVAFWRSKYGSKSMTDIGIWECCVIGVSQGIAVFPGLSRLGLTFVAALLCRMSAKEAAKYSLLLSAPTIFLANLYKVVTDFRGESPTNTNVFGIILGVICAAVVSYFAIKLFLGIVTRRKALLWFAGYCFLLGIAVIIVVTLR